MEKCDYHCSMPMDNYFVAFSVFLPNAKRFTLKSQQKKIISVTRLKKQVMHHLTNV